MFDSIAYSRIKDDQGPVNTVEHLKYCAKLPFTTLKADLRPTADGRVVLCHDKGFTLDENGRIGRFSKENYAKILDMTLEECLALEHSQPYDGAYCRVCGFEPFICICKESRKNPFITVRDEEIDTVVKVVLPILEKYCLLEKAIINSFTLSTLQAFRRACPTIRLSYVLPLRKVIERKDVDMAAAFGNCILTSFHFTRTAVEEGRPVMEASADALSYAAKRGVPVYQAQVSEDVPIEELIRLGYSGAQLLYSPREA